ncbi:hypothetical protein Q0N71_31425 [Bacillus thuringiensis]|uniref:hypothetical protein n=1 Tax=Bacillus thuringiensis TaxID=1428 RepID=UPI003457EADC
MKLMQTKQEFLQNNDIKPPNYLIEHIGNNQYLLHREIAEYEKEAFRKERFFRHQGRNFLPSIEQFTSEKQAKLAIDLYWKAIKQLS